MHRRRPLLAWSLVFTTIVLLTLYLSQHGFPEPAAPGFRFPEHLSAGEADEADEIPLSGILSRSNVTSYLTAILDPRSKHLTKLDCLDSDFGRYKYLRSHDSTATAKTQYFFALNLRENLPVLPRLLGSVVEVIKFLGPEHCALSIVEGNSPDGTADVLAALKPLLDSRLRTHFVLDNDIDPLAESRFARLADLRNLALSPMLSEPQRYLDATVVFLNDVVICPDDILELIHQRRHLKADMTCAMDWIYGSDVPTFYDVYIARGINGDLFFNVPPDTVSWSEATNLFWNDEESKERFSAGKPLQVFACWNGAVAFAAEPVVRRQVAFRAAREGECYNGEPEIFCKDLWFHGYGKIAVVPYINLVYATDMGKRIKDEKGYTSQKAKIAAADEVIAWKQPPKKVKCMPSFERQTWHVWDDTLSG